MWAILNKSKTKVERILFHRQGLVIDGVSLHPDIFNSEELMGVYNIVPVVRDMPVIKRFQRRGAPSHKVSKKKVTETVSVIEGDLDECKVISISDANVMVNGIRDSLAGTNPAAVGGLRIKAILAEGKVPTEGPLFDAIKEEADERGVTVEILHGVWKQKNEELSARSISLDALEERCQNKIRAAEDMDALRDAYDEVEDLVFLKRQDYGLTSRDENVWYEARQIMKNMDLGIEEAMKMAEEKYPEE